MENIAQLKSIFAARLKDYPLDAAYITALAKGLGLKKSEEWKLFSVMGAEELSNILQVAKPADFQKKKVFYDKDLRLNLHSHTEASDGEVSIETYLDNAVRYADLNASHQSDYNDNLPFFTIALTDHDTVANCLAALKLLVADTWKYRNLRLVIGVELSTVYRNKKMLVQPLTFELLWYGLNPFAQPVINLLSDLQSLRMKALDVIFADLNQRYAGFAFNKDEFFLPLQNARKGLGVNIPYDLLHYLVDKTDNQISHDELRKYTFGLDNDAERGFVINQELQDIFKAVKASFFGIIGVAHPARIDVGDYLSSDFIWNMGYVGKDAGREFIKTLLGELYDMGMLAMEINYQHYSGNLALAAKSLQNGEDKPLWIDEQAYLWVKNIHDFAASHNMLKTGGFDCHHFAPF